MFVAQQVRENPAYRTRSVVVIFVSNGKFAFYQVLPFPLQGNSSENSALSWHQSWMCRHDGPTTTSPCTSRAQCANTDAGQCGRIGRDPRGLGRRAPATATLHRMWMHIVVDRRRR